MLIHDLCNIDYEHEVRAQRSNATGTPARHRIPELRFYHKSHDKLSKEKKKMAEKEAVKMWGSKEMANKLKVDPKRLRTILRAAGKGLESNGDGRYQWKPNDEKAIAQVKKVVDEYEAKAAERAESSKTAQKKSAKKATTKKTGKDDKKAAKKTGKKKDKKEPAADEEATFEEEAEEEVEE